MDLTLYPVKIVQTGTLRAMEQNNVFWKKSV